MQPKVALGLKFCSLQKVPDFKASITIFKGIANLPWVASELSNPQQTLTYTTVAHGPMWLCAFGPAVLYGCTSLS